MTTDPTEGKSTIYSIARRFGALLYLVALVTVIPIIVVTVVFVIVVAFDFGTTWYGLQSMWLAAYGWASQQAIFLQVAVGLGLFFIGLPLTISIVVWLATFIFGGAFVGVASWLLALNREARILLGRSVDELK